MRRSRGCLPNFLSRPCVFQGHHAQRRGGLPKESKDSRSNQPSMPAIQSDNMGIGSGSGQGAGQGSVRLRPGQGRAGSVEGEVGIELGLRLSGWTFSCVWNKGISYKVQHRAKPDPTLRFRFSVFGIRNFIQKQ